MADFPSTWTSRRQHRWAAFLERRTFVRHPVSPMRHRIGLGLLISLLLGFALYTFSTRDEAIRRRAVSFLTDATSGDVQVGQAKFRMFGGITLEDVSIAVPYDKSLDPLAKDRKAREIFAAKTVILIHNPWRLLLGSLHVDQIIATQPIITLTQNVDTDVRNWQLLRGARKAPQAKGPGDRPRITLRSAMAVVVSVDSSGHRDSRVEKLDADVRPHPQVDTGYCIEVRRFTEPAERTTVIFDPGARLVTNTPFVDARTVRLQLPKAAQELFDGISLKGEVKLNRLVYDAQAPRSGDTEIRLRNGACAIPLSLLRSGASTVSLRPADGVIQMTDVMGKLAYQHGRWNLDAEGLINGASCKVNGTLDIPEGAIAEMGLDLQVRGTRVRAPTGSLRDQILTDPKVPAVVREIVEDYNPNGPFDVDIKLVRPTGPEGRLQIFGIFEPQGMEGTARAFPYRMDDLHGQIRVDANQVTIKKLVGCHGPAVARIDSEIDLSSAWADISVQIDAKRVPLEDDLFRALSKDDRALWKRFNPRGAANLSIQLRRPSAGEADPQPPWNTSVSADLLGAEMLFAEFPYPLKDVTGILNLTSHRIELQDVVGRQEKAVVHLNGFSTIGDVREPKAEVHVDAVDLPLDGVLEGALPPEGKGAFASFQPEGRVHLSGTVSLSDPKRGLVYDLRAKLCDAAIRYREFPYRIEKVGGEIAIRPEGFSVVKVAGRHGSTRVEANGQVRRNADGYAADLTFHGADLELNQDLYDALPLSLRQVWHLLKPSGTIDAESSLHYVTEGNTTWQRHRTLVTAKDARLCFQGFPLPLEGVAGQAIITDQQVEILSMRGRTKTGTVEITGRIDLNGPGYRGSLAVVARDMAFDDALFAALPARVREAVESMHLTGRFDLDLDELRFDVNDDGEGRWDLAGRLTLRDAGADLGVALREVTGIVQGRASVNDRNQPRVQARAELEKATLAGWKMEHAVAKIATDPHSSTTLHVLDATADAYGGEATGSAEITLAGRHADYQVSVIARDVQLSRYLQSLGNESEAKRAGGSIFGNMILQGRTGANGYREGAGEMFVRHAQVWRLPLMFAIFQVLNLTPDENVFHDGRLQFYLSRDTLVFQQIDLQGSALALIGGGRMELENGQLDVTLLSGSPLRMRLPLLTDLLDVASKDLRQVHVTGTLSKPTISPQPLYSLAKALKSVFPEAPRQMGPRPLISGREAK